MPTPDTISPPAVGEPFGFVLWCDVFGVVQSMVWAHPSLASALHPGRQFADLAAADLRADAEALLNDIRKRGVVLDASLPMMADASGDRTLMHLAGCQRGTRLLVIGGRTRDDAVLASVAGSREAGAEAPSFLDLLQEGVAVAARGAQGEDLFDELSRLNNELVNAQRELARKNAELETSLRTIGEMQEKLMAAERDRVLMETAGAAAHEINQPLSVVTGLAQIMESECSEDDAKRQDLAAIREAAAEIAEIVRRMQEAKTYAVRSYVSGVNIVDLGGRHESEGRSQESESRSQNERLDNEARGSCVVGGG